MTKIKKLNHSNTNPKVSQAIEDLNPVAFQLQGDHLHIIINLKQLQCEEEENHADETKEEAEAKNTTQSQEAVLDSDGYSIDKDGNRHVDLMKSLD